jgi:hypothetical protein
VPKDITVSSKQLQIFTSLLTMSPNLCTLEVCPALVVHQCSLSKQLYGTIGQTVPVCFQIVPNSLSYNIVTFSVTVTRAHHGTGCQRLPLHFQSLSNSRPLCPIFCTCICDSAGCILMHLFLTDGCDSAGCILMHL